MPLRRTYRRPVQLDGIRLQHRGANGSWRAVDAYASLRNQSLAGAPRAHAGIRKELL